MDMNCPFAVRPVIVGSSHSQFFQGAAKDGRTPELPQSSCLHMLCSGTCYVSLSSSCRLLGGWLKKKKIHPVWLWQHIDVAHVGPSSSSHSWGWTALVLSNPSLFLIAFIVYFVWAQLSAAALQAGKPSSECACICCANLRKMSFLCTHERLARCTAGAT